MTEKRDRANTFHSISSFASAIAWILIREKVAEIEAREDNRGETRRFHRGRAEVLDEILLCMGGTPADENASVKCPHCKNSVLIYSPHENIKVS